MATHSSILAWRIPGTEEPGGLPSMGLHRVVHDWSDLAAGVTWMQSQKWQNDLCSFPRQTIQYHSNASLCPTSKTEEAEVERFYEDLQDLLELIPPKNIFSL